MPEMHKICPNCGAEYLSRAQTCSDCEIPLQWDAPTTEGVLAGKIEEAGWDNVPEGKILGQLTVDDEPIIESYLGHLAAAGIHASILPFTQYKSAALKHSFSVVFGTMVSGGTAGHVPVGGVVEGFQYMIFVGMENYDKAEAIIRKEFAALHPGQEHGFAREYEIESCPACGFELGGEEVDCPDCGLCFG